MTDYIFGIIIIALLIAFIIHVKETNKEKSKLLNALIAKTPEQARDLNLADKVQPIKPQITQPPDVIPLENLSEDEFDEHIKNQLNN